MNNLQIRQGTNEAWFIYDGNKVLLGSHDRSLIEKVYTIIKRLLKAESCKHKYSHYTNEYNETVAVCEKCLDVYFKTGSQDCVQISQSQNNQDQQFINQLLSELHWERDVVVPDLEQKLSSALTAMYDLASMLNKLEISQNEAEHVEKALQFYNENRHYKKPVVTTSNTNDDGLPF